MGDRPSLGIPYVSAEKLQDEAERLRLEILGSDQDLPVNSELIAEKMGLEIWQIDGMTELTGFDALVVHSISVILVDKDRYNQSEQWGRLRFTIAHEIGHYSPSSHVLRECTIHKH